MRLIVAATISLACGLAQGQFLLVPDISNSRIMLADPVDGHIIDYNFIPQVRSGVYNMTRVSAALQVGEEIWVTDFDGGTVYRFSRSNLPVFRGRVLQSLNAPWGLCEGPDHWVLIACLGNWRGSIGNAIAQYSRDPVAWQGTYFASGPMDIANVGDELLVAEYYQGELARYGFEGVYLGPLGPPIAHPRQISLIQVPGASSMELWVAAGAGVFRLSLNGDLIHLYQTPTAVSAVEFLSRDLMLIGDVGGTRTLNITTGEVSSIMDDFDIGIIHRVDLSPCYRECPADFNRDGGVTGDDVRAFFQEWEAGSLCGDVNGDGGTTGEDVEVFFRLWEAGAC